MPPEPDNSAGEVKLAGQQSGSPIVRPTAPVNQTPTSDEAATGPLAVPRTTEPPSQEPVKPAPDAQTSNQPLYPTPQQVQQPEQ